MSPVDLCTELNRIFPMSEESTQYFTLLYGILDTRKRIFRYVAAGHHATETFGIRALGDWVAERFGVTHHWVDIPNPV